MKESEVFGLMEKAIDARTKGTTPSWKIGYLHRKIVCIPCLERPKDFLFAGSFTERALEHGLTPHQWGFLLSKLRLLRRKIFT